MNRILEIFSRELFKGVMNNKYEFNKARDKVNVVSKVFNMAFTSYEYLERSYEIVRWWSESIYE